MNKNTHFLLTLVLTVFLTVVAPISQAANGDAVVDYQTAITNKASRGLANLFTGPLEIPKNIINTMNDTNLAYGMIGGGAKGILNMVGRMFAGLSDVVTFVLPTQSFAQPVYVWDDFDVDTSFGRIFRLEKLKQTAELEETPDSEVDELANNSDEVTAETDSWFGSWF